MNLSNFPMVRGSARARTANAWRPDHRPLTLREESTNAKRPARTTRARPADNHRSDSAVHNRIADAMDAAGLAPRARLAREVADMWRVAS